MPAVNNIFSPFDNHQASLLAVTAQDAEVSELQRKLQLVEEENIQINKRLDEAQGLFQVLHIPPNWFCKCWSEAHALLYAYLQMALWRSKPSEVTLLAQRSRQG